MSFKHSRLAQPVHTPGCAHLRAAVLLRRGPTRGEEISFVPPTLLDSTAGGGAAPGASLGAATFGRALGGGASMAVSMGLQGGHGAGSAAYSGAASLAGSRAASEGGALQVGAGECR